MDTDPARNPADPPASLLTQVLAHDPALCGLPWHALPTGRTNRLWRVGGLVVKLYDPAAASPLFPNDPQAEAAALSLLAPEGLAPALLAQGQGWIAYAHVPGDPWASDSAPVARTLARLHALPPEAPFRRLTPGPVPLLAGAEAIAAACLGRLPPPPQVGDPGPTARLSLIHGDAVPGNLIVTPEGPVLIDWQCPAIGDAAEDIATFLSPAMQHLYRGNPLTPAEREAFLVAYPDRAVTARYRALAPLYHWRMAAHCLWKAERGAPDYATGTTLELVAISAPV